MVDLFPAGWTSVGILKGVSQALAAEDVATLCGDNETPILHNLQNTTRSGRHECPRPGAAAVPRPAPLPIPKMRPRGRRARLPWGHTVGRCGGAQGPLCTPVTVLWPRGPRKANTLAQGSPGARAEGHKAQEVGTFSVRTQMCEKPCAPPGVTAAEVSNPTRGGGPAWRPEQGRAGPLTSEYPSMQIGQLTVPEGLEPQGFTSVPAHAATHARRRHRSSCFPRSTL